MESRRERKEKRKTTKKRIAVILILFIWLFSMVASGVLAVPPFQVSTADSGLEIEVPLQEFHPLNEDKIVHIHLFNSTTGFPINSSEAECSYEIYDDVGNYVIDIHEMEREGSEFEADIGGDNFSTKGSYRELFMCNTTSSGGFQNRVFEVTERGVHLSEQLAMIYMGLLFFIGILTGLSIIGIFKTENVAGKYSFIGISYLLSIALTFIAWNISNSFLNSAFGLTNVLFLIFRILLIMALPFFIISFIVYLFEFRKLQQIKSLIEKGVPEDESLERLNKKW